MKLVFENSENDSPAEISIFNAVGQAVLNRSVLALAGENIFEIEIGELPQGVYQVVLRAGEERFSESLVVLRK